MGDGRACSFIRCALPTTEFLETPSRRPLSDALRPASQRRMSYATRSFVQLMRLPLCFWLDVAATNTYRLTADELHHIAYGQIVNTAWWARVVQSVEEPWVP